MLDGGTQPPMVASPRLPSLRPARAPTGRPGGKPTGIRAAGVASQGREPHKNNPNLGNGIKGWIEHFDLSCANLPYKLDIFLLVFTFLTYSDWHFVITFFSDFLLLQCQEQPYDVFSRAGGQHSQC